MQNWLAARANDIVLSSGNVILSITHGIANVLGAVIEWLELLISTPAFPSPYPEIGFLGVLASPASSPPWSPAGGCRC